MINHIIKEFKNTQAEAGRLNKMKVYDCWCFNCLKDKKENGLPIPLTRMILCPSCGNKRCPRATWHGLECTNSNEPGQPGSRYE